MKAIYSLLAVALILPSFAAAAEVCGGEACAVISVTVDGDCYVVTNSSPREVRLQLGAYSFAVQPGVTQRLFGTDGRCIARRPEGVEAQFAKPVSVVVPSPAPR